MTTLHWTLPHLKASTHYIVPDVRSESHVTKNQCHSSNYCYTAECNVHAVIHRFSTEFFFCAVFKLPQGFSSQWGTRFSAFPDLNNLHNKFPTELGWFIITKLMMYKIQTKTGCSNLKKKNYKDFLFLKVTFSLKTDKKLFATFYAHNFFRNSISSCCTIYRVKGEITEFQMFWVVACFCTVRERSWGEKDTGLLYFTLLGYETSFVY